MNREITKAIGVVAMWAGIGVAVYITKEAYYVGLGAIVTLLIL